MDEDADQLIIQLSTQIGMIMEDVVEVALTTGAVQRDDRRIAIDQLAVAAERINSLVQAAKALLR